MKGAENISRAVDQIDVAAFDDRNRFAVGDTDAVGVFIFAHARDYRRSPLPRSLVKSRSNSILCRPPRIGLAVEGRKIRFDIDDGRAIHTIEIADFDRAALSGDDLDNGKTNRVGADGRTQCENSARARQVARHLLDQIAAREVQPIEHDQMRIERNVLDALGEPLVNFKCCNNIAALAAGFRTIGGCRPGRAGAADEIDMSVKR